MVVPAQIAAAGRAALDRLRRPTVADLLVLLGLAGLAFRLVVAHLSVGSNDIIVWKKFGGEIWRDGLGHEYDVNTWMNHPPAISLAVAWLHAFAGWIGARFEFVFKVPFVLADALSAWLIARSRRRAGRGDAALVFALFCWNPVSILISGYHGNTDSLCAALALLAAVLVDEGRPGWGGVALGASINVKLIPILLIPAFLSCLRSRRQVGRFLLATALGGIPFLPIALTHWHSFRANALEYHSHPGEWGVTELGREIGMNALFRKGAAVVTDFWIAQGRRIVLAFPVVLAAVNLRRRRLGAPLIGACVFAGFLVLTPGWGVQYTVYLVPFLFATRLGYAIAYGAVTGAYLVFVYAGLWTGTRPFYSEFTHFYDGKPVGARLIAAIAWTLTVVILVNLLRARRALSPQGQQEVARPAEQA